MAAPKKEWTVSLFGSLNARKGTVKDKNMSNDMLKKVTEAVNKNKNKGDNFQQRINALPGPSARKPNVSRTTFYNDEHLTKEDIDAFITGQINEMTSANVGVVNMPLGGRGDFNTKTDPAFAGRVGFADRQKKEKSLRDIYKV